MKYHNSWSRRRFLQSLALGVSGLVTSTLVHAATDKVLTKAIPSSGERLPVIGLGSSRTFNVGSDPMALDNVTAVISQFFNAGGKLLDSSPMYGSSQQAIGFALNKLAKTRTVFSADKVWTWDPAMGSEQMEQSRRYWQVDSFDLMQVHNLVEWEQHLKTLYGMKQQGRIRYVGISTSHGRRHDELEAIMKSRPLDFIQCSYNILDREAEQRLLPLAKQRGIAVIINRPFQRGDLIAELAGKPLPTWARTIACDTWPQFLLKFIVSHPSVTCAIPATTQVAHVRENMSACIGPLPDQAMRQRMVDYVERII